MKLNSRILAAAVALGLGALAPLALAPSVSAQTTTGQVKAAEQTATFAIENMTCALCPITVRTAMERVDGVKSVAVDFDAKTATVAYNPSTATIEAIAAASTNAGYPAHAVGS